MWASTTWRELSSPARMARPSASPDRCVIASPATAASLPGGRTGALRRLGVVMRHLDDTAERIIARLATAAHGVVARRHLLQGGVTKAEIGTAWSTAR